jgi:signal transduction histidine kinase
MINEAVGQRLGSASWVEPVEFDATLITSELVTNAIQAGCSRLALTMRVHRSHIRLTVSDDGAGFPQIVYGGQNDSHGRGLALVAALTHDWGVDVIPAGKEVWADLALPETAFPAGPLPWCHERDTRSA